MKTPRHIAIENAAADALTQMEQASRMFENDPEWNAALKALQKAFKTKEKPTTVHVVVYDTDAGIGAYAFSTEEAAKADLAQYVRDNWESEMSDEALPEDDDEAVAAYFESTERERAHIEELVIN